MNLLSGEESQQQFGSNAPNYRPNWQYPQCPPPMIQQNYQHPYAPYYPVSYTHLTLPTNREV